MKKTGAERNHSPALQYQGPVLFVSLFVSLINAQSITLTLVKDTVLPVKGSSFGMSCNLSVSFNNNGITVHKNGTEKGTCLGSSHNCIIKPGTGIILKANLTGVFITISSLDRDSHEGTWTCAYSVGTSNINSNAVYLTVYIPVTTVQLMTGSGQVLSSSVNIIRGQSNGIRCSTAPNGSRPRALFQWYIRQGNQSPVLIEGQSISPTPDPESVSDLLISYSTWNMTGNASYHDMYIFCQAQNEANTGNYIKSDNIQLNIVYPPAVLLSTYQSIYNVTEGMQNFVFSCSIIESNPQPQANSYSWFHSTSIIQGQTSSSYTLPSVQRSDAGEYKCTAKNDYGTGTSNSLNFIVQYPPIIAMILTGSIQQNQTAILICGAMGVPAETTFYPWVQMWGDVVIRTGLQGQTNSTHSVLTLDRLSLESMGTYVCTASNGIMGISGTFNQTGSESLHVKGAASILTTNAGFVGEISLSANMSISFYCDPPIERFAIWKNSREIMNTSRTITSLSSDIVNYIAHNKTIKLNAQKAHFVILNVTVEDFNNYTLVLTNSFGSTSFEFHLDAFGPPLKVQRFYFNKLIDDQIELHFDAGFNGGPDQTFVIEYMSETSFDSVWQNINVPELRDNEILYRFSNGTFLIMFSAPPPGHYIYRMYSWNVNGRSPFSDNITVTIPDKNNAEKRNSTVEAVAGGVGAAVVVLVIIIVVLILLRRRSFLQKKSIGKDLRVAHGSKGPEYTNTAFRSDINTTEYEALQLDRTGESQYEALNDPESKLNQSTDIRNSSGPRPSVGAMFYENLQPCDTNQGSPRPDEGENKLYENTVMSAKYIHE